MGLENKVVLITGAARGIGAETARRVVAKGARVSLVGLEPERLRALADELGERAAWFEADVTDQAQVDGAVAGTVAAFGGIDVMLANAGVGNSGTVAVAPPEVLLRTIDINVDGVVRTVSATLPHVTERRGYVMIVSSTAAFTMAPGMAAYAASMFRGYSTTKGPTGPPVDVEEEGTLLVFACETCGEQLVLLRKGTDAHPRHCAEKMVLRRVPTPSSDPDPRFN